MKIAVLYIKHAFAALVPDPLWRRVVGWVLFCWVISIPIAFALHTLRPSDVAWGRAQQLEAEGHHGEAERAYWDDVKKQPADFLLLMEFLRHHAEIAKLREQLREGALDERGYEVQFVVPEAEIDVHLEKPELSSDLAIPARYWRVFVTKPDAAIDTEITEAAGRTPPPRFANHVLGRVAMQRKDIRTAALRLVREGRFFPERRDDFFQGAHLLVELGAWDDLRAALDGQSLRLHAYARHRLAMHDHRWFAASLWALASNFTESKLGPLLLALVSGIVWALFGFTLGKSYEPVRRRRLIYGLAIALGVLSILPTDTLIAIEDSLGFHPKADVAADLIFYVFGVGLREELCKTLLVLPLIPWLKRRRDRLEVMTVGSLVGLGFAAVENIQKFAAGSGSIVLARFLTANFLHMSLTAIAALAVYDLAQGTARDGRPARDLAFVVVMHGAYDFFLSVEIFDGSAYISSMMYVVLVHLFFSRVDAVRGRPEPDGRIVTRFSQALGIVLACSYIYAARDLGLAMGAVTLTMGLLSLAIIIIVFVRQARHLSGFIVRR